MSPAPAPAPDAPAPRQSGLLAILGVGFGLAGAVGGTIGAGILRTPGLVAADLGSGALVLLAWLVGGLYALLGAVCVAELGAALPQAGGWYVYARRAFGEGAGFSVGWMDWLGHCTGVAWVAITAGEYGGALVPALAPHPKLLALVVLALFGGIQWLGLRAGSGSQQLLSLAKAVAFLALVAACFLPGLVPPRPPDPDPLPVLLGSGGADRWWAFALAMVLALQPIVSTYDGWHSPIYFAEEFEDPARDLPRSLLVGVAAVIGLYLLVNLALLHVLPLSRLAASSLPAADAAALIAGPWGGRLITALALLSVLGLINAAVMSGPRVLWGLARDALAPPALMAVNGGGTPSLALVLTVLTMGLLVLFADFTSLLAISAIVYVALYASGYLALLVLRRREPDLPRPYQAWAYPWSALAVLAGSLLFLLITALGDWPHALVAAALIAIAPLLHALRPPQPAG
ncbi:MAG: APC family permease [Synechococcaceae cyanobacterium]|nr:APC family permease [Synechococcaceae cyanobacterium]